MFFFSWVLSYLNCFMVITLALIRVLFFFLRSEVTNVWTKQRARWIGYKLFYGRWITISSLFSFGALHCIAYFGVLLRVVLFSFRVVVIVACR